MAMSQCWQKQQVEDYNGREGYQVDHTENSEGVSVNLQPESCGLT